ncbi:gp9 [Enterobacter cloacae]|uniref:Gp9 n=1 Tax=Enterobacter cloacae TaxID=550 RepID=A0A377M4Z0_ENTCL|nr:gp9 [Enterobacter cloacae]
MSGTLLQAVLPFAPVKEIRMSFALTGNEFIAYVRRRDVISPLVVWLLALCHCRAHCLTLTTTSRSCLLKACKLLQTIRACLALSTALTWRKETAWLNTKLCAHGSA